MPSTILAVAAHRRCESAGVVWRWLTGRCERPDDRRDPATHQTPPSTPASPPRKLRTGQMLPQEARSESPTRSASWPAPAQPCWIPDETGASPSPTVSADMTRIPAGPS